MAVAIHRLLDMYDEGTGDIELLASIYLLFSDYNEAYLRKKVHSQQDVETHMDVDDRVRYTIEWSSAEPLDKTEPHMCGDWEFHAYQVAVRQGRLTVKV